MTGGKVKTKIGARLREVKANLGKTGEVLVETMFVLHGAGLRGQKRLRGHMDSALGDVASTADAAKADATEAKTAAEKAAGAAETAKTSAEKAQSSAEEASQNASAMADDTKKATEDAASALKTAEEAKQTATSADSRIGKVLDSLKLTVNVKGKTIQLEGAQTLRYVLEKINDLLTSYNSLKREVEEAKSGSSDALTKRVDDLENDAAEELQGLGTRVAAFERSLDSLTKRVDEMETDAAGELKEIAERLKLLEGGKS